MSKGFAYETVDSDRLKRIKRNRQIQLQRWMHLEKENLKNADKEFHLKNSVKKQRIIFNKSIMLLDAISNNDVKEVKELLEDGANPNAAIVDGLTGLHQCAIDDFIEMAILLLKYHANVNAVDSDMWTPLHAAATCSNGQMCIILCKHGADVLALNADGHMPYEICEEPRTLNIIENEMSKQGITQSQIDDARMVPEQKMLQDIKIIIQNKWNLNEYDSQGAALIHVACSLGYSEVVQMLLEAGANYSLPDKDGWLPIHLAACWSHVDVVECLVVFGADIIARNSSGETVFDLCETDVREKLVEIKENISYIRKNYNFSRAPSNKSFRRSHGSSVRRTSVRQKNLLSKKEAKEEFIALTHTMSQPPDNPSTIEEGSDVDSAEISVQGPKVTVNSLKLEDRYTKHKISHSPPSDRSNSQPIPAQNHSPPPTNHCCPVNGQSATIKPQSQTDPMANNASETNTNHKNTDNPPTINDQCLDNVDALGKPRYVFSSPSNNWDNAKEEKRHRSRKCCSLL